MLTNETTVGFNHTECDEEKKYGTLVRLYL